MSHNRNLWKNLAAVAVASASAFALAGCGNFNISTKAQEELAGKTVTVHMIGVNPSELERWKTYSVTQYFRPGDPLRESAVAGGYARVMNFGPSNPNPQELKKDDEIWRKWHSRHGENIVVLACLPGYSDKDDKAGSADPRRLILPMSTSQWRWAYWGKDTVDLEISRGKVTCLNEHKPAKP